MNTYNKVLSSSNNKLYKEKPNKNMDDKYLKFYSNAKYPYNKLSNFYYVREGILYNGLKYPSVEHAYQASKFNNEEDKKDFTLTGKYGTEDGFRLLYEHSEYQNKQNYWMRKESIGILAKMAYVNNRGELVGRNLTGKWLMMIRDEIKNNENK
ncbi:hypothetical protein U3516DRAFT_778679 [Neocallimastix sp. 'constans']